MWKKHPNVGCFYPAPPKITKPYPFPMIFEVLTAVVKTGRSYHLWEEPANPIVRIEETFKPKCQAIWGHSAEDSNQVLPSYYVRGLTLLQRTTNI